MAMMEQQAFDRPKSNRVTVAGTAPGFHRIPFSSRHLEWVPETFIQLQTYGYFGWKKIIQVFEH